MTTGGEDVFVLGFSDLGHPPAPQPAGLRALAPRKATILLADAGWATADGAWLERLAASIEAQARLVCVGFGAGAYGALYIGRLLGASAIFAAVPGARHGATIDVRDLEDLAVLFEDPELAIPGQYLRVLAADDSQDIDIDLADRLRHAGAAVVLDRTSLPSVAAPLGLMQSGVLARQIAAWINGDPVPELGDLAATWQEAFAHGLEIDLQAAYRDGNGVLQLPGRLLNRSPAAFDLAAAGENVRFGARPCGPMARRLSREPRAGFPAATLPPGQAVPFHLSLDGFAVGDTLELGLVCDGRFWFDAFGFPSIKLQFDDEPIVRPSAAVGPVGP